MNRVFIGIVALAFIFAVVNGTPAAVGMAALNMAKASVDLAIGLIGYICLFLGLMKIVEEAGGLAFMARLIRPLLVRIFPDIPADHPAMGAMVMNIAANALGLGNAATPFGLKAMKELNSLNTQPGTATNAMALFLAINTSGLALLPTGIIGLRAKFESVDPAAIFPTTLFATACSTLIGIMAAKFLSRRKAYRWDPSQDVPLESQEVATDSATDTQASPAGESNSLLPLLLFGASLVGLVAVVYVLGEAASAWIMPVLIVGMILVGVVRKVPVYEAFVKGAKEGFGLGIMIIPYLVAILCTIGMLRASGGLEVICNLLGSVTGWFGLPGEALPLALLRPLSGSGAFGITAELIQTHGPDSYIGNLVSTMQGSTETTFYVLAVYFGSVGINRYRHALWAGLCADFTGVLASVLAVNMLLTPTPPAYQCQDQDLQVLSAERVSKTVSYPARMTQGKMTELTIRPSKADDQQLQVCGSSPVQMWLVNKDGQVTHKSEMKKNPKIELPPGDEVRLMLKAGDGKHWESDITIHQLE